ncbi:hypothetical protein [Nostoc commune]|uniref:hypothetical protein n=1 Tax=Nostoc commune TaxID=1178 RepID=UPI0018C462B2|nr:hypothetical protein [Nostoc commune]MBG1259639.1 hypothetical protein [Nostoc commune BAE]
MPHSSINSSEIPSINNSTISNYEAVASANPSLITTFSETTPLPHSPWREPVSGSCSCPYDFDKAGRMCGGRSAYSRPGGSQPACYQDD